MISSLGNLHWKSKKSKSGEAREKAQVAAPLVEDDVAARIEWLRAEAFTRAATGDALGAVSQAEEALSAVSETDLLPVHAETVLDLASVLAIAGHRDEALASAATARVLFERKGHLSGMERANRFTAERAQLAPEH